MAEYETIDYIKSVIEGVLNKIGVQARVEYEDSLASGLVFNIFSRDAKLLIGRQGETLYALEHIIHSMVSRSLAHKEESENPSQKDEGEAQHKRIYFSLDVDDYKRNRQYQIKQLIKDSVSEMKRSGKSVDLPFMSKQERKFAHMYVQEQFPHVTTISGGREPQRFITLSL